MRDEVKSELFFAKEPFAFISAALLEISSTKLTVRAAYIPVTLVHLAKH